MNVFVIGTCEKQTSLAYIVCGVSINGIATKWRWWRRFWWWWWWRWGGRWIWSKQALCRGFTGKIQNELGLCYNSYGLTTNLFWALHLKTCIQNMPRIYQARIFTEEVAEVPIPFLKPCCFPCSLHFSSIVFECSWDFISFLWAIVRLVISPYLNPGFHFWNCYCFQLIPPLFL